MMTKTRFALIIALAIQSSTHAQSNDEEPSFRARTDASAVDDLRRLRDELNRASDVNGAVNPLGKFLERSARPNEPARFEIGPSDPDNNGKSSPSIDPKLANRELEPAPSKSKPRREIVTLPGPKLTLIQQAGPQVRNTVVDGFRPARFVSDIEATVPPSLQYPVTMAAANLPIVGQPNNYVAYYQEVPFGSYRNLGLPTFPVPGQPVPSGFNPVVQPNPQLNPVYPPIQYPPPQYPPINVAGGPATTGAVPIYSTPATNSPVLPPTSNPSNIVTGGPAPNSVSPIYSTPIQNTAPVANNPVPYYVPPPVYGQPMPPQNIPLNPNPGLAGPGSPSDSVLPSYNRTPSVVNGAPFVSNPPRQFDARNMVACNAYRPSADPCFQPCRSNPSGYASSPYGTGGSPLAYAPPTWMPKGRSSGFRPLIGFGQGSYDPYLGRGIFGQPVAYVDGQPIRNFTRYLFP